MVDPERRPSAQEIEELIDLVRRDPSSPAFIDLGEAYLALGRPRDAIKVAGMGLESSPDNLEGRVMLARAHASLHQWKEAQGELLRVVKVDRSNRTGFALLGEVLLRRSDFERAVPVLQHAQNLDPTSPQILSMLKRARNGQPLDAPAAVPQPMPPRGETENPMPIQRSERSRRAMGGPPPPTAPPPMAAPRPAPPPLVATPPSQVRTQALQPSLDFAAEAPAAYEPPPPPPLSAPPRQHKPTAPPPPSNIEGVRPRVVSAAKPQNAAAASLRQSAAVGETYLNDLLTGGLLDVAGVRVPDSDFDLRPDRRWGRSTRRAFIFLFVVLVLGVGGGGTWYWWTEKQKAEAVARLQKEAKQAIGAGDYEGLRLGLEKLTQAIDKDGGNVLTFAYIVEIGGLKSLLYGGGADEIDRAFKTVEKAIAPGEPGSSELVIGKAALDLASIHRSDAPATILGEVDKSLDTYLAKNDGDKWAHWLKGRALLAGGERKAARAAFKGASDGDDGLVLAMVDYGNLLVDDGKLDDAIAAFDKALAKAKDHPLAVLGKAIGRAENAVDVDQALNDLNDKFKDLDKQPRVGAYRQLGFAIGNLVTEDYAKAAEALQKATGSKGSSNTPGESRFWARVAWANYTRGDLKQTAEARAKCVWYSKKPEDDPSVQLVDAGLLLASGLPDKALDLASKIDGVRPRVLRAYALIDLGKPKDALAEAEAVLKIAPENIEAKILLQQAKLMSEEKGRDAAAQELVGLSRKSNSKLASHALGVAYLAVGDAVKAKEALTKAITDVTEAAPNPFEYRTHTALAEIALSVNDLPEAGKHLDAALKLNSGYFPTLALQAKVVLRNNEPDRAMDLLKPIYKESSAVTPTVQLTLAEALITHKGVTQGEKDQAKQIITEVKDKLPPAEVSRVAAQLDPKLPKELGLPEPEGAPGPVPLKQPPPKKRR